MKTLKKICSILIVITLVLGVIPAAVIADDIQTVNVGGSAGGTLAPDRAASVGFCSDRGGRVRFKLTLGENSAEGIRVSLDGGGVSLDHPDENVPEFTFTCHLTAEETHILTLTADREISYSVSTRMIKADEEEEKAEEPAGEKAGEEAGETTQQAAPAEENAEQPEEKQEPVSEEQQVPEAPEKAENEQAEEPEKTEQPEEKTEEVKQPEPAGQEKEETPIEEAPVEEPPQEEPPQEEAPKEEVPEEEIPKEEIPKEEAPADEPEPGKTELEKTEPGETEPGEPEQEEPPKEETLKEEPAAEEPAGEKTAPEGTDEPAAVQVPEQTVVVAAERSAAGLGFVKAPEGDGTPQAGPDETLNGDPDPVFVNEGPIALDTLAPNAIAVDSIATGGEIVGPGATVKRYEQIAVNFSFSIPDSNLAEAKKHSPWTLDLSANFGSGKIFSALAEGQSGKLIDKSTNAEAGTYTVSAEGLVSLEPSWDWLKNKTTGVGGTFSVTAELNETTNDTLTSNTFNYPGGTATTITFTERELKADKYEYLEQKDVGASSGWEGHAYAYDTAGGSRPADSGNPGEKTILVQEDGSYRLFYQIRVQANTKATNTLRVVDTLSGGQVLDQNSLEAWIVHTESADESIPLAGYLTTSDGGFTLDLKGALAAAFTDPAHYAGKNIWIRYSTTLPPGALDTEQTNRAVVTFDTKEVTTTTTITPEFTPSLKAFKQIDTDEELRDPVTGQNKTMPVGSGGKLYFLTGGTLSSPANSLYVTDTSTGVAIDEDSIKVAIGNSEDWQGYEKWTDLKASGACTVTTMPDPSDSTKTIVTGFVFDVHKFIQWLVEEKKTNIEQQSFADLYKDLFYYLTPGDLSTFTLRAGTTFKLYYEGTALAGYMPGADNQGQVSNTATWHCNFKADETPSVSVTLTPDEGEPEIYKNEFDLGNDPDAEGVDLVDGTTGKLKYNIKAGTWVRYELRVLNRDLDKQPKSLAGCVVTDNINNFIKAVPETIGIYDGNNQDNLVAEYNTTSKTWTTGGDLGFTIQVVNDGSTGGWSHPVGVTADPNVNVRDALGQSYPLFKLTFPDTWTDTGACTIKYAVQTDNSVTATDALYGGHAVYNSGTIGIPGGPQDSATIQLNVDYGFPYDTVKRFLEWDKENNEAVWAVDIPLPDDLEIIRPLNVTEKYYSAQAGVKRTDTAVSADSFSFEAYELILPGYTTGSRLNTAADADSAGRNEYIIVDQSDDPNYKLRQLVFPKGINTSVRVIVRMKLPHTLSEQLEYHAKNTVYVDVDGNTVSPSADANYVDDEFVFEKKGEFTHNSEGHPVIVWTAHINPSGKALLNDFEPVFKDVLPAGLETEGHIHIAGYIGSNSNKAFMVKTGSAHMTGAFSYNLIDEIKAHWNDPETEKGVSEPPDGLSGWHFRIQYTTKFDSTTAAAIQAAEDAGELKDFSFTNNAEVWENGGTTPLKRDSDTVKYQYQDLVSKEDQSHETGGTIQVLSYRVVINEHHRKINGGRWVTLTDAIPANMDLMLSSVKVTDTAGQEMTNAAVSYTESTRRLQISVPDETTAVVTFDASPTGGSTVYVNTVVLSGSDFSQTSAAEVSHKVNSAGTLVGMSNAVQIKKVDKYDISTTLSGAKFSFYECTVADSGEILGETLAGQYVSDNSGMITFAPVKGETLYYWQETEAPPNYIIASSVPRYFVVWQELSGTGRVTVPWNRLSAATRAKLKEKFTGYPLIQGLSDSSTAPVYIAAVGPTDAQAAEYNTNQYCWLTAAEYPAGTGYDSLAEEVNAVNRGAADALNSKVTAFYGGSKSVSSVVSGYAWQVENIKKDVTTIRLQAAKTLNGRTALPDEFTFRLYNDTVTDDSYLEQSRTSAAAADGAVQTITFDDLSIVTAGTYKYRIVELPGSAAGTSYDPAVYRITVEAEYDDVQSSPTYGKLVAKITGITKTVGTDTTAVTDLASPVPFVNTYTQPSGALNLTGTKTLTGRNMAKGEFHFTVREGDTVVATGSNTAAADGKAGAVTFSTITYTAAGEHTYTVTEDDLKDAEGKEIPNVSKTGTTTYTVAVKVEMGSSGLAARVVSVNGDPAGTVAFTNQYEIPTVELTGTKVWADGAARDNASVIRLELYRFSETYPVPEAYTLSSVQWTGNTYKYEKLPEKDDRDKPWTYYVIEGETDASLGTSFTAAYANTAASGYAADTGRAFDGGTITNTPDNPRTVSAAVKKAWNDDGNRDGLRPLSITVSLKQNGTVIATAKLSAENAWFHMETGLPAADADGTEYVYEWVENSSTAGYTASSQSDGVLTVLTNTHVPEETEIKVTKVWADNDNEAGKRPAAIQVQLFADGKAAGEPVSLTDSRLSASWTGLPRYVHENGTTREIVYRVAETSVPDGYTAQLAGSASAGFVITNTYARGKLFLEKEFDLPETEDEAEGEEQETEIEVVKIWEDYDNRDGSRPESITVHLFAGGKEVRTAVLTAAGGWKKNFGGLPKFVNGHPIHYSVTEDPVEGYVSEIRGLTIRNRYVPQTVSVSVRKVWNDDGNRRGTRPQSVGMVLSNGMAVLLNEENGWTAVVTDLPAMVNGRPAVYTWTEQSVVGYEQESVVTEGSVTIFTNRPLELPDKPDLGRKPKVTGEPYTVIDNYRTALGTDVVINHVGDCFD